LEPPRLRWRGELRSGPGGFSPTRLSAYTKRSSGRAVARHDHGTVLSGFLPRLWDHLVASPMLITRADRSRLRRASAGAGISTGHDLLRWGRWRTARRYGTRRAATHRAHADTQVPGRVPTSVWYGAVLDGAGEELAGGRQIPVRQPVQQIPAHRQAHHHRDHVRGEAEPREAGPGRWHTSRATTYQPTLPEPVIGQRYTPLARRPA
jgi:hypothetical protein